QFHGIGRGGHARSGRDAAQRRRTQAPREAHRGGTPEARSRMMTLTSMTRSLASFGPLVALLGLLLKVTLLFATAAALATLCRRPPGREWSGVRPALAGAPLALARGIPLALARGIPLALARWIPRGARLVGARAAVAVAPPPGCRSRGRS